MKNSGTSLRTAYYTALSGNITIRGAAVPIYAGSPPITAVHPFIVLTGQTATDISGKGAWSDDRTIVIDIETGADEGITGPAESEDIATQVLTIIAPTNAANWPDLSPGFKLTTMEKVSENDLVEGTDTDMVWRKVIRMRHQIHEL